MLLPTHALEGFEWLVMLLSSSSHVITESRLQQPLSLPLKFYRVYLHVHTVYANLVLCSRPYVCVGNKIQVIENLGATLVRRV